MQEDVASIVQLLNRVSRIQWRSHPPEFIVKFEQELLQRRSYESVSSVSLST